MTRTQVRARLVALEREKRGAEQALSYVDEQLKRLREACPHPCATEKAVSKEDPNMPSGSMLHCPDCHLFFDSPETTEIQSL